jgi:transcription initiation factor TFIIH subunit 3
MLRWLFDVGVPAEQQEADRGQTDKEAIDVQQAPQGGMSAAFSKAMCMLNRASIAGVSKSRILVVQCARDFAGQYIACMNSIFSAQRLGVVIDGICPTMDASSFIEQVRFQSYSSI